ncbi:SWIM zinc finger family protein [Micromonospora sp. WMMD882]|uniref:SWIM zinc finger family protein n=1 Tax=Micromonospora sp. WMMD882 TaxID=3015151 RepID=UPI00248CD9D2|nr:SWIM zinc finger family protein [Micromonospora sp. WMMD882]WBB80372.1 SWIM zinc finger family protein [Micromonospora sp. WMMD882]
MVWFDEADLRRRAGNTSYVRGIGYVNEVDGLSLSPTAVTATVQGTGTYQVWLGERGGRLVGECSCPWGQEGHFCKHCVAVGLTALNAVPAAPVASAVPAAPAVSSAPVRSAGPAASSTAGSGPGPAVADAGDLRAALDGLDKAALVDLLLEFADRDPQARRLLSLRVASPGFDAELLGATVDSLRRTWHLGDVALARLARAADSALRALDVFAPTHPGLVRPLYQRAVRHLTAANLDGQPEDGLAAIRAAVSRATDGVVATCEAEPADPAELVRWLIDVQLRGSRFPDLAVRRFAGILGADGLDRYRRRLAELDDEASRAGDGERRSRRHAIFRLREAFLVDVVQDVDQLVALYADDLSQPGRYVRIGATLRAAGRFDEAVDWLRRGLAETLVEHREIGDLLVTVYVETGRLKEAARARLDIFRRDPDEYHYRMLLRAAEAVDAVAYARAEALTALRERAARGGPGAADPLVRILVADDDVDRAWAAAQEFPCGAECMLLLAGKRAKRHPADAIPVYEREVDRAIARPDRTGYASAARLLVALRDLHQRAGSDFDAYLQRVRAAHRRRSALMKELADAGL